MQGKVLKHSLPRLERRTQLNELECNLHRARAHYPKHQVFGAT
jgi:hypothetical protein